MTTSGTLSAGNQQMVYLQPDRGELKKILVKPGQKVKKGDRLIEYENPTLKGEKEQAELQVQTAKVKLNSLYRQKKQLGKSTVTPSPNPGQGAPGSPNPDPGMAASKEEIDQQIQLTRLELKQAQKQLELAKSRQNRLFVRAENNGTVVQINENQGAGQSASEPVVVVADLGQLKVTANISEYDALKVKEGQTAAIKTDALPDKKWSAQVEKIGLLPKKNLAAEAANEDAQVTYPVELNVKESVPMKLGSRLILEIVTSAAKVKALPQSAIKEQGEQTFVFVVEKGKAVQKTVKVGRSNEQFAEIVSGITADHQVIVNPTSELASGAEVKIR
nr:efflux RND transporter periplasmic adaptor subunit [Paenactinomyces guangxiensis]